MTDVHPRPLAHRVAELDRPTAGMTREPCRACDEVTTHTRNGCVVCLDRPDTRRVGLLWLALSTPPVAAGVFFLAMTWHLPITRKGNPRWLGALLLGAGLILAWRGLRKLIRGR